MYFRPQNAGRDSEVELTVWLILGDQNSRPVRLPGTLNPVPISLTVSCSLQGGGMADKVQGQLRDGVAESSFLSLQ